MDEPDVFRSERTASDIEGETKRCYPNFPRNMNTLRVVAMIAVCAFLLKAEDFSLTMNGVGPITVHTALQRWAGGEFIAVTATNDSGLPLSYVKLCVTAAMKGCLFTLWTTAEWEPGAQLQWTDTSARKLSNLSHEVKIQSLNATAARPSQLAQSGPPPQPSTDPTAHTEPVPPKDRPTPIPAGVTLCLQPMPGSFDDFLIGEMEKQRVPVTIIATVPNTVDPGKPGACDANKSSYTMTGNVIPEGKSFSARGFFGLRLHLRDEIQAAVKLVRNNDNAVVWAGDADRGEVKTVAEHIVNQMLKQRPIWLLSPITR